jgi:hypothetical protein
MAPWGTRNVYFVCSGTSIAFVFLCLHGHLLVWPENLTLWQSANDAAKSFPVAALGCLSNEVSNTQALKLHPWTENVPHWISKWPRISTDCESGGHQVSDRRVERICMISERVSGSTWLENVLKESFPSTKVSDKCWPEFKHFFNYPDIVRSQMKVSMRCLSLSYCNLLLHIDNNSRNRQGRGSI